MPRTSFERFFFFFLFCLCARAFTFQQHTTQQQTAMSNFSTTIDSLLSSGTVWQGERKVAQIIAATRETPLFSFGLSEIDNQLSGGLALNRVHQFALEDDLSSKANFRWHNPLLVIAALLGRNCAALHPTRFLVVWIGRRVWPTPHTIQATFSETVILPEHHLFLSPFGKDDSLWTAIQFLKHPQTAAVVLDAAGFSFSYTRRLSRAARIGNTPLFLLRPPWEATLATAAKTKWQLAPVAVESEHCAWQLRLERAAALAAPKQWLLSWNTDEYGTHNTLNLLPDTLTNSSSHRADSRTEATRKLGLSVFTDSGRGQSAPRRKQKRA